MSNYLIYSLEDDEDISSIIKIALSKNGLDVVAFSTGEAFLEAFRKKPCDLLLLDLMLPKMQGKEVLESIKNHKRTRVIVVSAKSEISDKVELLDLGADDYLPKPFDIKELVSRVKAQLRRVKENSNMAKYGPFEVIIDKGIAKYNGHILDLTPSEYLIYLDLIEAKGEAKSREKLEFSFRGKSSLGKSSRALDMHIKHLKGKIDGRLSSVYGVGYRLDV